MIWSVKYKWWCCCESGGRVNAVQISIKRKFVRNFGSKLNFSWKEILVENFFREMNFNEEFLFLFAGSSMNFLLVLSIALPAAFANSESEKWSWPTSVKDRTADSRKDIYYESVFDNEKSGRIRVPTSYYDNRRWRWSSSEKFSLLATMEIQLRFSS